MTKIRISAHSLEIEVGRYNKISSDRRFCKFCKTEIENEHHFILKCPKYNTLRQETFLNLIDNRMNESDLIREVLNPKNPTFIKSICKYIKEANVIRKEN